MSKRLEANDLVMSALICAYETTGYPELAKTCKEIYQEQRVVMEAEEILKIKGGENV